MLRLLFEGGLAELLPAMRARQSRHESPQTPALERITPLAPLIHGPPRTSLSSSTYSARAPIQNGCMTPPTNNSVIRNHRQPSQEAQWTTPIPNAPASPGRQYVVKKLIG